MRLFIFDKAKYFLDKDLVKIIGITKYSISFLVGKYHVVAKYINHQLIWTCDCFADANQDLCSHKIAAQTYLVNNRTFKEENYEIKEYELYLKKINIGNDKLTDNQKKALREMVNFRCQRCHKTEDEVGKLEPHRIKRGVDGGLYVPQNIMMLCKKCHDELDYI